MLLVKITLILTFLIIDVFSNAIKYRTCEDSSFCRRCRKVERNSEIYTLLPHTMQSKSDSITYELINRPTNKSLIFKLDAIKNNTFRFQIDEKSPLHKRYRVDDALKGQPNMGILKVENQSDWEIIVTSDNNKAVISINPFEIDFYHNNVLLVSVNSKGLMHFEHLSNKPNETNVNNAEFIEEYDTEDNANLGDWEEYFLTYFDSKPNGPEAFGLDFTFPKAKILFGIPQHADSFALKSTLNCDPYRLYNVDVPFYGVNSNKAMYGSVPILYGHGPKYTAGVFWHNSAETWIDIYLYNKTDEQLQIYTGITKKKPPAARFMSESGIIDVFILLGPTPLDAFKEYTDLTGTANLPQLYTLGYHQSRWNYINQDVIENIANNFDINDIPMDAIWLDMEYTNNKKLFTWNPENFPKPLKMIQNLTNRGHHVIITFGSHIPINKDSKLHNDSLNNSYYVNTVQGVNYKAWSWFGLVSFLDYLNPAVRKYWSDQYQSDNFDTITNDVMIWNNMNEPSIFSGPEGTMVKDNIHYNNIEHRNVHNLYGHMSIITIYDSLIRRDPNQRPFILTRSHFAGTQRYAAISMGDNAADWEHLKVSIQMCLTESVAGFAFCGADVGSFVGNPTERLIERWYQAAIYQPFFRSHSFFLSPQREPWYFNSMTENKVRLSILKRYSYLPFWYTMFYEHEIYGLPIMRPLLANYPFDINSYEIDTQYLLQDRLLICPILVEKISKIDIYFPTNCFDTWYDIDTYTKYNIKGYKSVKVFRKRIPVFQRSGTIIPKKEHIRRTAKLMINDPYTLIVCLDENEYAKGTLYIDDEKTYDYRNGKYIYIEYEFKENQLTNKFLNKPNYLTKSWLEDVVIVGLNKIPKIATLTTNTTTHLLIINNKTFMIVRKPGVNMADQFVIKLIY